MVWVSYRLLRYLKLTHEQFKYLTSWGQGKCGSFLIGTGREMAKSLGTETDICSTASRWDHSLSPLQLLAAHLFPHFAFTGSRLSLFPVQREDGCPPAFWASSTLCLQTRVNQSPSVPTCARDILIGPPWVRCPSKSHPRQGKTPHHTVFLDSPATWAKGSMHVTVRDRSHPGNFEHKRGTAGERTGYLSAPG